MKSVPFLRRHPLVGYLALAYGITWTGIQLLQASRGFDLGAPHLATRASPSR